MKQTDRDFERKILEMKLHHPDLLSREEEEMAWKEILLELDKKDNNKPLIWKLAASVLLISALTYWLLPGKAISYVTGASEQLTVELPDRSEVTLNGQSSLILDKGFGDRSRLVSLDGEAFFNVKHDPSTPFVIVMDTRKITVIGTSFNVRHQENGKTIVTVQSGKVRLSHNDENLFLTEKQKGMIDQDGRLSTLTWNANDVAWYTGKLQFQNKTLSQVSAILSQYTSKPVDVVPALSSCKLTLKIEYDQIEEVLDIIAETLEIQWREDSNKIIFYGEAC